MEEVTDTSRISCTTSALLAPVTRKTTSFAASSAESVKVIRFGGGFGESSMGATNLSKVSSCGLNVSLCREIKEREYLLMDDQGTVNMCDRRDRDRVKHNPVRATCLNWRRVVKHSLAHHLEPINWV